MNKLDNTISKIKITVIPEDVVEDEDILPKAFIRIRIPRKKKEKEEKEDGEGSEAGAAPEKEEAAPAAAAEKPEGAAEGDEEGVVNASQEIPKPPVEEWEEIEIEDKCIVVNPSGAEYKIWVIHEAAGRALRKDIVANLKKVQKEFEDVDFEEFNEKVEQSAVKMEKEFIEVIKEKIPVFDFEIN